MRKFLVCGVVLSLMGIAGCRRTNQNAAVEAAIQEHLKHNAHLMLNSFTTHFVRVSVSGDMAQALVKYDSKNVPNLSVQVDYGMKKINGKWRVVSSSSTGGQMTNPSNPHAGATLDQTPPPQGSPGPVASH